MGKVTFNDETPPDHPIYTEAVLTIGARLTQPDESSVTKSTGEEVEAGKKSNTSAHGKQTLLELALSKGFTLADPNDPIYKEGSSISVAPSSCKQDDLQSPVRE
jgi:hypothetical protein